MSILKLNNRMYDTDDPPGDPPQDAKPTTDDKDHDDLDKVKESIPYERWKPIYDESKKLKERIEAIENAQKGEQEKALKEQNKWKELFEAKEREAAEREKEIIKLRVAQKKGLPADLVDRLVGETEQELEADADKLLEFVKPGEPPGTPPRKKGGQPDVLDIKSMTPEEIRKNADKLLKQGM
jgi:hypothetical protein